jgi:2-methylisocitrate lyase-like PEP mutase family enzyme
MSAGAKFRELLARRSVLVTPGLTTPLHAMLIERAGFEFAYMGGYDVSLTLLGLPDVGLITANEMIDNARHIARSIRIPLICDADTGYGNAINVIRTVQDYEAAGVAGIHIEDQVSPKRCGHVAGKLLISRDEMVGKLKAALDARRSGRRIRSCRSISTTRPTSNGPRIRRRSRSWARSATR